MGIQRRIWIGTVFLGACARLLPHPWNFTPMTAIGTICGGYAALSHYCQPMDQACIACA
jgi:hypothetical protein